jgi:hypothetical protein
MTERPEALRIAAEEALPLATALAGGWQGRIAVLATTVPREQVTVPICPTDPPTDEVLYEDPADPGRKFWLPRYRLGEELVSGQTRYQLRFLEQSGTWRLRLRLVPFPPPSLAEEAGHPILPHTVKLQLSYGVLGAPETRKALPFQEVAQTDEAIDADLVLSGLAQRDEVLSALKDPVRAAQLTVRRKAEVAVQEGGRRGRGGAEAGMVMQPLPGRIPMQQIRPVQPLRPTRPDLALRPERPDVIVRPDRPIITPPFRPEPAALPVPRLSFLRSERDNIRGTEFVRFYLSVDNWRDFAADFFAASPNLPPCGANTNAGRSWVDIVDSATGARIYGFCALGQPQDLTQLWFARQVGTPIPASVRIRIHDRLQDVVRDSNDVAVTEAPPPAPGYRILEAALDHTVDPQPFAFSPDLHGYVFGNLAGGGGPPPQGGLIRLQEPSHVYFQEAAEPERIYFLPDDFRIARLTGGFRSPFMTLRVRTVEGAAEGAQATLDLVVVPHTDPTRLAAARTALAARTRIDPASLVLQPINNQKVRFFVQRPTLTGRAEEERPADARLLQGPLFDTLTMPLADFQLAFDAMLGRTASLFGGRVEIDVAGWGPHTRPFVISAAALDGPLFDIALAETGEAPAIELMNAIESPVALRNPTLRATRGGATAEVAISGEAVVAPGETAAFAAEIPELPGAGPVRFELAGGATVQPDDAAVLHAVLDRSTLEYYREIEVRVSPTIFEAPPGLPATELITSVFVDFESGETVELTRFRPTRMARVDYPFDNVILRLPVETSYRYTKTVVYQEGEPIRDPAPSESSGEILILTVVRRPVPPPG